MTAVADVADQPLRLLSTISSADAIGAVRERDLLKNVMKGKILVWLEEAGKTNASMSIEEACKASWFCFKPLLDHKALLLGPPAH